MSSSFYNTINYSGERLAAANARALSQEELIKEIFLANPKQKFSPSQMLVIFKRKYDRHPPLTSIRRAMSTLSHDKRNRFLVKTDQQVAGPFLEMEHLWELRETQSKEPDELQEFWDEFQNEQPSPTTIQPELF